MCEMVSPYCNKQARHMLGSCDDFNRKKHNRNTHKTTFYSTVETLLKLTLNSPEPYLQQTLYTPDTPLKLTFNSLKTRFKYP